MDLLFVQACLKCVQRNAAGCAYTHTPTQCTSRICTELNKHLPSDTGLKSAWCENDCVWITRTVNLHTHYKLISVAQRLLLTIRTKRSRSPLPGPVSAAEPTPGSVLPNTLVNNNLLTAADLSALCSLNSHRFIIKLYSNLFQTQTTCTLLQRLSGCSTEPLSTSLYDGCSTNMIWLQTTGLRLLIQTHLR